MDWMDGYLLYFLDLGAQHSTYIPYYCLDSRCTVMIIYGGMHTIYGAPSRPNVDIVFLGWTCCLCLVYAT
jgi:hypothetical protein